MRNPLRKEITLVDYLETTGPSSQAFQDATERLRDLSRQGMKMAQRTAEVEAAQPELPAAVNRAELHLQAVQTRHARGLALDEELRAATDARAAAIAERERGHAELQTLRNGRRALDAETEMARKELANARWQLIGDIADRIQNELQADAQVSAKLAWLDALGHATRDPGQHVFPGGFDFGRCLQMTFPEPDANVRAKLLAEIHGVYPPFTPA